MSDPTNDAIEYFDIPNFTFQDGTVLSHVRLAYKQFNATARKTALIPTCFRGRIRSTFTFAQGALRDYRIIVVALFGNGESSSPSNTMRFPCTIDYRDCVRAQHQLLTQCLGLRSVDVIAGFSMGGQTAYHWLSLYPDIAKKAVIICSSARTSRHNYQFLEGPKAALENSSDYTSGSGEVGIQEAPRGIRAFGKAYSAWLTSTIWFEQERYKDLGYETLADWDRDVTGTNYQGWDPRDLLAMLGMWQRGDISSCSLGFNGSVELALRRITAQVLLLPCQTDQYFYWGASDREARWMPYGQCKVIPSVWGHLAGAGSNDQDNEWLNTQIKDFLETA